jgi:hypothetical protein
MFELLIEYLLTNSPIVIESFERREEKREKGSHSNSNSFLLSYHILFSVSSVSREGLAPIVKAYSRLILVDGLVL